MKNFINDMIDMTNEIYDEGIAGMDLIAFPIFLVVASATYVIMKVQEFVSKKLAEKKEKEAKRIARRERYYSL